MYRPFYRGAAAVSLLALAAVLGGANTAASKSRHKEAKPAPKAEQPGAASVESKAADKPSQLGSYGDWSVFVARGEKSKICYALATPKDRAPSGLSRDPAYMFISNRPGENVRLEISVILGFPAKEDGAKADVGGTSFALIAKGANAWIKTPAEESHFVDTLKKGSKLVIKAASVKGNVTTDGYSLAGLSQALEKVEKECP